ncbi:CMRF35-like molecule 3 [Melanotaenia boesemani]|uniref:CMRF35-like molecule 3 n=1 Tax=Melanotaenia boesemani TaxID=1250792 RepID=UPI001C03BBD2|nr:CMRF35-like molecule 3 [Melanotaenia boesemani]
MFKICMCTCLLLGLTIVEMKVLKVTGHVGEKVTFKCCNWKTWTEIRTNVKYLCEKPCKQDKHIIIKAALSMTENKDRIQITNVADCLFVTFMDLKLSDSKTYYCGVERFIWDSFIEVNLQVIDGPITSVKITTAGLTSSFPVTTTSTMSSRLDMTTNSALSYSTLHDTTTATAVKGAGSVPYLIVGFIVTIVSLIVLLQLMRTMKRQHKVVGGSLDNPQDNTDVDSDYENTRREDQQTESQTLPLTPVHLSTTNADTVLESLYENHSFPMYEVVSKGESAASIVPDPLDNMIYSLVQQPKEKNEDI